MTQSYLISVHLFFHFFELRLQHNDRVCLRIIWNFIWRSFWLQGLFILLALVTAEDHVQTAELVLRTNEMGERTEKEQREDQWEDDGACDQYCELIEDHKFSTEQNRSWPDSCYSSTDDTDPHLTESFLNSLMPTTVEWLNIVVG